MRGHSSSVTYARGADGREVIEHVLVVAATPGPRQLAHRTQRLTTLRQLAALPRARAAPGLGALLRNDVDALVRARSAEVLGGVGGRHAVAALTAALADPVPRVRMRAARALTQVSGSGATDTLVRQLDIEPDAGVRRAIVSLLGRLDPTPELRGAVEAVAREDANPVVRRAAAAALEGWSAP
jgi:HEAT repeat protein